MKTLSKLFMALVLLSAFTCNKDVYPLDNISLSGNWNMKNVSGGLIGLDLDYNIGDVIWNFNTNTSQLSVTNNILTNGPKSIYAKFQTGTYSYYIDTLNTSLELYVDSSSVGLITVGISALLLDDGVATDGFLTRFEK